jgi:hypothetical protein
MKITPSLKWYFLGMMIMTGFTTITIMSVVSFNYFLTGIDFSMSHSMGSQAYKKPISDGQPQLIDGFIVSSRWVDLPELIQENLNKEDLVEGKLLKKIDGTPPFSHPRNGYFAMMVNRDGQTRYISSMFTNKEPKEKPLKNDTPPFSYLIIIALAAMFLFSLVPYFILRKVTNPVEKLMTWTKKLNKNQLSQPAPDFYYSELNTLASIVQSSLQSVQESLEREKQFLGYASHELRTPIAVTRTNTELLRKMITKEINTEKQLEVVDRIERASLTMTDLTETLLWLNRQSDKSIPIKPVAIGLMVTKLLEDLTYLLNGKKVDVTIKTDQTTHQLPEALCQIVLNNLIRNALQHTDQGSIVIEQSDARFVITNHNLTNKETKEELGFGLGLELTERLVKHYGWHYINNAIDDGHYVEINFA